MLDTPCAEDGTYGLIINQTGGFATNIEYGVSTSNNSNLAVWSPNDFLILDGDGVTRYLFVRYGVNPKCIYPVGTTSKNCTGATTTTTTTTSSTTTTTPYVGTSTTTTTSAPTTTTTTTTSSTTTTTTGCAGAVNINSITVPKNNQLSVNVSTALSSFNWKVKLNGTTLAGGSVNYNGNPQLIDLTSINFGNGTVYRLFTFGDGCSDGIGRDFSWNGVNSTTTSSTTTTTSGNTGCSGVTAPWRYNGQAGSNGTPYAFKNDALFAACFGGSGCTGYVNSPTVGQTFYKDKNPANNCTFNGCSVLPTGWYWIYPLSNVNDVYIIHVVNGVIDDVTANPCT